MAKGEWAIGNKRTVRGGVTKVVSEPIFQQLGLRKLKLPKGPRPTFTEAYLLYGDCLVSTVRHLAAVVDGALQDIWDGRTYCWEGLVCERKAQSVWVPVEVRA